jgi:quinol monooxygenase YgiN
MFIRIVKLTIAPASVPAFHALFEKYKSQIRNQEGCRGLRLLIDKNDPRIHFTYSHWEKEEDLERYRNSALFAEVWGTTKTFFEEKAQAWSVDEHTVLP